MKILLSFITFTLLLTSYLKGQDFSNKVFFSGEQVPLEYNSIANKLNVALKRSKANTALFNKIKQKSAWYFPFLEARLAYYGIPNDFKYLPIVESHFKNNAVSVAGATGFWQLMPGTAKDLGMNVNLTRDERNSIIKSTDAACKHLLYLYKELKNWTLVAAAYNVGLGSIKRSMAKQKIYNYYFLKLNSETAEYVYKILAVKMHFNNDADTKGNLVIPKEKPAFNKGRIVE